MRAKILRATARLFARKGYHDTTLEEVRRAAKVTTGAFFHHFGSKEDLGLTVPIRAETAGLLRGIQETRARPRPAATSLALRVPCGPDRPR